MVDMTWAEIFSAVDYVFKYELREAHTRGAKQLKDWVYPRRDTLREDMQALARAAKNGTAS